MRARRAKYHYKWRGKQYTCRELAEKVGVSVNTMSMRLLRNKGIVSKRVLSPVKQNRCKHFLIDSDGFEISLSMFCRKHDLSYKAILYRYKQGCRNIDILCKPSYCLETGDLKK